MIYRHYDKNGNYQGSSWPAWLVFVSKLGIVLLVITWVLYPLAYLHMRLTEYKDWPWYGKLIANIFLVLWIAFAITWVRGDKVGYDPYGNKYYYQETRK